MGIRRKNRKSALKFYEIGVVAMFILFGVTSEGTKKTEEAKTEAKPAKAEQKKELTAEEKAAKEEDERIGYETGITYDQLARTPDEFKEKKTQFTGKVL